MSLKNCLPSQSLVRTATILKNIQEENISDLKRKRSWKKTLGRLVWFHVLITSIVLLTGTDETYDTAVVSESLELTTYSYDACIALKADAFLGIAEQETLATLVQEVVIASGGEFQYTTLVY